MRHVASCLTRRSVVAMSVLALAGCANPMLDVRGPGYSLAESRSPAREPQSMAEAVDKLNHMRAQYYQAIRDQTGQELAATQGLVWLGTLIAGMAAGDVHRDALLVSAGIGGTTYGLARTQLDPRRALIWAAGMEALDCAKQAALPLDLGPERIGALEGAAGQLRSKVVLVQQAQQKVTELRDQPPASLVPSKRDAAALLVERSDEVLAEAGRTQAAAAALLRAVRGGELSVTVDRVHTQVTRALRDIAVGLDSIKSLIGGLGGFAAVLAPGAGVDTLVSDAMKAFNDKLNADKGKAGAQAGQPTDALDKATADLQQALRDLAVAQVRLAALAQGVDTAAVSAALKACQVAGVATPLVLTPALLQFEPDKAATKGFEIGGGTPPYMVAPLDQLPDTLSLQFAGGLSETVQVKAGKGLAEGQYRLRITDSGASKASRQLEVRVTAGGGITTPPPVNAAGATEKPITDVGNPPPAASAWQPLAAALQKRSPVRVNAVDVTLVQAAASNTGVALSLRCVPSGKPIQARVLKDRLTIGLPEATALGKQLDNDMSQITLASPDNSCTVQP